VKVELVLNVVEDKKFLDLYPFQLFQVFDNPHIYCKINDRYARTISQETSFGRNFKPDEPVILLVSTLAKEK
jgi:hypothetical protein